MSLETNIITLIILIALSAFFSGVEIAIFSISHIKLRHLLEQRKKGAKTLNELRKNSQRLLITILIGNNVVNIGASALATAVAIGIFENNAVGIVTGVMTLIILTFGEIIPKSVATKHNEKISLVVAKPLKFLQAMLFPIVFLFEILANSLTGGKEVKPTVTEKELITAVMMSEKEGEIKEAEKEMIHRIFKFDDIDVEKIMTPLAEIISVDEKSELKGITSMLIKHSFSRIPVYKDDKHNIVGILFLKDVMSAMNKNKLKTKVKRLTKKPLLVPDTKKVDTMLRTFQKQKQHMAIVVDEHGAVRGLVTIEDVLEEIVGEIVDETDKIEPAFTKITKKSYIIRGNTDIDDFNKKFKLGIKAKDIETVSGFIVHILGKIPKTNEKIKRKNYTIIVKEVEENRVKTAKLILK